MFNKLIPAWLIGPNLSVGAARLIFGSPFSTCFQIGVGKARADAVKAFHFISFEFDVHATYVPSLAG